MKSDKSKTFDITKIPQPFSRLLKLFIDFAGRFSSSGSRLIWPSAGTETGQVGRGRGTANKRR